MAIYLFRACVWWRTYKSMLSFREVSLVVFPTDGAEDFTQRKAYLLDNRFSQRELMASSSIPLAAGSVLQRRNCWLWDRLFTFLEEPDLLVWCVDSHHWTCYGSGPYNIVDYT